MHMCVDPDPLFAILIQKATYNTRENFHYKTFAIETNPQFFSLQTICTIYTV